MNIYLFDIQLLYTTTYMQVVEQDTWQMQHCSEGLSFKIPVYHVGLIHLWTYNGELTGGYLLHLYTPLHAVQNQFYSTSI
jgi:hypothetical protein